MSMTDKQKEKAARIPAIGVAGEQSSHMYNKTIIADAVGSDNLQNDEQLKELNEKMYSSELYDDYMSIVDVTDKKQSDEMQNVDYYSNDKRWNRSR